MQTSNPTLNRFLRTALQLVGLTALVIMVLVVLTALVIIVLRGTSRFKNAPISPIEFGHVAVPTSTNANSVCVTLTNQSDFVVLYLTKPLQVCSNGIWSGPPGPPRQTLTKLLPRQSGVVVVDAALTNQNTRVPVFWGYGYTSGATRWQQLREDLMGRVNGRGGRGFLYTNYLTALKL